MYRHLIFFAFFFTFQNHLVAAPKFNSTPSTPIKKLLLILSATQPSEVGVSDQKLFETIVKQARCHSVQCHILAQEGKKEWVIQDQDEQKKADVYPFPETLETKYYPFQESKRIVKTLEEIVGKEPTILFIGIIGHAGRNPDRLGGKCHTQFLLWRKKKGSKLETFSVNSLKDCLARDCLKPFLKKTYMMCSTCYSGGVHRIAYELENVVTVATTLERMAGLDPKDMSISFAGVFFTELFEDSLSLDINFNQIAYLAARRSETCNFGLAYTSSVAFLNQCLQGSEYHSELMGFPGDQIPRFDAEPLDSQDSYLLIPPDCVFRGFPGYPSLIEGQWNYLPMEMDQAWMTRLVLSGRGAPGNPYRFLCPMIDEEFLNFSKSLAKLEAKKKGSFFRKMGDAFSPSSKGKRLLKISEQFERQIQSYLQTYQTKLQTIKMQVSRLYASQPLSAPIRKWIEGLENDLKISGQLLSHWFKREFKRDSDSQGVLDFRLDHWVQALEKFIRKRDSFLKQWIAFLKNQQGFSIEKLNSDYRELILGIQPHVHHLPSVANNSSATEDSEIPELSRDEAAYTRWLAVLMSIFRGIDQLHVFFQESEHVTQEQKLRLLKLFEQEFEAIDLSYPIHQEAKSEEKKDSSRKSSFFSFLPSFIRGTSGIDADVDPRELEE